MPETPPATVDAYIAAQPAAAQAVLTQVRRIVREAMPDARETISYKIPTYRTPSGGVLYFAGWKKHYALYPLSAAMRETFAEALAGFEVEKDTIRFGWDAAVPAGLIAKLAAFAAAKT